MLQEAQGVATLPVLFYVCSIATVKGAITCYFPGSSIAFIVSIEGSNRRGERKWVERNGSNRPPVRWVESSPFRNWVEWTWVDLEKCQVQGRQHIDFDPSPFDPIRPQSIRPKLFDQKGRPKSSRPISFDPFHAIRIEEEDNQLTFGMWQYK